MRTVGRLGYIVAGYERKNTIKHLTMAYGHEKSAAEIKDMAKKVFLNFSVCIADAIRLPLMAKDNSIDDLVDTKDFDKFKKAVDKGNGVILMTGHYGNWELMGTWVVRQGFDIKVVAKPSYDPRLDKLIVDYRNQAGYANTAKGNAVKDIEDSLTNGNIYGLLFDLDTKVKGVFVNFFGKLAHTATIPVYLSGKYGSPIVPMFIRLKEDYRYEIMCFDPLEFVNTGNMKEDIVANTQICSDFYEMIIRRYPEQWIWMHRRWKKQPK